MLRAGLRSSSYGPQKPFPDPAYWVQTSKAMADLFPSATPAMVWIVSEIKFHDNTGNAGLNFPAPLAGEGRYSDILFSDTDKNEEYLNLFDQNGIKVWLQVEPGETDMVKLIDLVLSRYSVHPCVMGFGVDVEWHKWNKISANEGTAVTDAEARSWLEKIHTFNPDYQLFLKHWLIEMMPPNTREGIAFLNDSQQFPDLGEMVQAFKTWGEVFSSTSVGFQFGYKADKPWWGSLANPPKDIGKALLDNVPNCTDLYWVDFTMEQIWKR